MRGKKVYLAIVIEGDARPSLREKMRHTLKDMEEEYGERLSPGRMNKKGSPWNREISRPFPSLILPPSIFSFSSHLPVGVLGDGRSAVCMVWASRC